MEVVVIGGGLAGVSAALTAADSGADTLLLEQRPHLGGSASSFVLGGHEYDHGQHIFMRCCTAYRSLLERIGAADRVNVQDRLEIPVLLPGEGCSWIRRDPLPLPLHLGRSVLGYRPLSVGRRLSVLRAAVSLKRLDSRTQGLDRQTFASWLTSHGQSPASIERFWDLIVLPTINLPSAEASLAACSAMFRMGLLEDRRAADIGLAQVPLGRLHHGLALKALEGKGANVSFRTKVRSVQREKAGPGAGVIVTLESGERIAAGTAVVAVPHTSLRRLLPDERLPDVEALGTSAIVDVHLRFDRRTLPFAFAALLGDPALWAFDRTEAAGVADGQYLVLSISGADRYLSMTKPSLVRLARARLEELFPDAAQAGLKGAMVLKAPAATFRSVPGAGALRLPADCGLDPIFLAGSWTDTGWPATMESAVRSGIVATRLALGERERRPLVFS